MPFMFTSRSLRIAAGLFAVAAGIIIFVARPGTVFAHHLEQQQQLDCYEWNIRADYIGGSGDRKVVTDVVINGEHIFEEFYFDNAPGHLGHPANYVVLDESGSGSVVATGTVKMYEKRNGSYVYVAEIEAISANLVCASTPTATATATATATSTNTPEPTATDTPVPTSTATNTPESTPTTGIAGTVTPLPTDTPVATATRTPDGPDEQETPEPTDTPRATSTPDNGTPSASIPTATPTYVDEVRGATPPAGPDAPAPPPSDTGTLFPDAGNGTNATTGMLAALVGLTIAGGGLALVAHGLRRAS